MITKRTLFRRLPPTAAMLTLLLPLTGCGGGSNGAAGGGSPLAQTTTLTGTVLTGAGSAAVGETVVLDGNNALSGVTNSQGQFTLTVPLADITGHDTLAIYNSQGALLQTQSATAGVPVTITLPVVPNPPTNLGGT